MDKTTATNPLDTRHAPVSVSLSYADIRRRTRADVNSLAISSASVVWLNTLMISASLGLLIYAAFSQELFFAGERESEVVFGITLSAVLVLWYVHIARQLLASRNVEFFADGDGAYILVNSGRNEYFFVPWQHVRHHTVARGYYNGSAAAISLHTYYSEVPEALIKRGRSHGVLENGQAVLSVIPGAFVLHQRAVDKLKALHPPVASNP